MIGGGVMSRGMTRERWLLETIDKMSGVVRAARCLMGIDRSWLAKVRAELGEALLDLDRFYRLPPPDCRGAAGRARPKKKGRSVRRAKRHHE